ncbi:hypothetical protein CDD80_876 [Ophiocordyceps camponoti-rufipedis]|uniref:Uncharacterized protein n=1 Tax=Ophiocordyceps camponoti-rufipedis TaxID=2004952 RepID=A0A2C5XCH1_9HYPO|nr:hypothetical protein CDD80_876 [Ophiocordyceps camponoti-rufipedis]
MNNDDDDDDDDDDGCALDRICTPSPPSSYRKGKSNGMADSPSAMRDATMSLPWDPSFRQGLAHLLVGHVVFLAMAWVTMTSL